ncbi:hypothetical protein K1T71_007985 [Dendrolimus kikuchii]|uniref:Uncharacterized protein n=1 Tax=Dendrolimus kikuchii TaxID=765133 RepID=A0ACC1CYM2_9NEOP|nr:hypothetical protein K1T71_007985 [Dendrolimus kikuchii]
MEPDGDMVLVIIGGEDEKPAGLVSINNTKENIELTVKREIDESEDDFEYEYLEDAELLETLEDLKSEPDGKDSEYDDKSDIINPVDDSVSKLKLRCHEINERKKHMTIFPRRKPLRPSEYKSFVKELKMSYPNMKKNKELLIDTLAEIMRGVKVPKLPEKFCEEYGTMYKCIFCEAISLNRSAAGRHYQERHGAFYLICYACGLDFRCTLNLYRHEKRCRAPDARTVLKARARSIGSKARGRPFIVKSSAPVKKNKYNNSASFPCFECSAVFSSKVALTAHENMHKGVRPYRCDSCLNAYTSAQTLYRHMKTHTNEKYICDQCKKSFKTKATITEHMNTHRSIKRFQCEECDRRFAHKPAMVRHVDKVHRLLPPPCVCKVCEKRFMRMSALKTHMKKAHGWILISRNMFQKALPKMSDVEVQSLLSLQ